MEPDMIRRSFSLLTDAEIKAFEAALATGGEYVISEEREDDFATLSHLGYAFIDPERGIVHIPTETESLYRDLNTEAFRLNRRKIGWIIRCLNEIVPPYYAILPMSRFCRLCRRTEAPQIAPEEVPALLAQIPDGFTSCVVTGDGVCSRNLVREPREYEYVVSVQGDKPWYIMREKELAELLQYGYPPHETSYKMFQSVSEPFPAPEG